MTEQSMTDLISKAKASTTKAKDDLLRTFGFVPDDRLERAPSATARTPVWIAAHGGVSNGAFATILSGKVFALPSDPQEAAAMIWAAGREITSRGEAVRIVEESTADVLKALDAVTPEMLASSPDSPFGPIPFVVWTDIPAKHMSGHARQIDYMQTIWGDIQNH